jgi:hypothetical protein
VKLLNPTNKKDQQNKNTKHKNREKKKGKIYLLLFEYFLLFDKGFLKSESVITINLA